MPSKIKLGVNVDHVATVRQARRGREPDPVALALLAEEAGADGITAHLRMDRRHILDRDVRLLKEMLRTRLNLEMSMEEEIVRFACDIKPHCACLVPERREELTTEGGLNVAAAPARTKEVVKRLQDLGTDVSLFIDAQPEQVEAAAVSGAKFIELHTGRYADAKPEDAERELTAIVNAVRLAKQAGLRVNAGHGLNYLNVGPVAALPDVEELNIGHSIVSRALSVGMRQAVSDMIRLMREARFSQ